MLRKMLRKNRLFFDIIHTFLKILYYFRSILILEKMKIDLTHVLPFLDEKSKNNLESRVSTVYDTIFNKIGAGNDFLGWVSLPSEIDENLLADIEKTAEELRKKSEIFVVIGIGGSYLGARAVIEALQNHFAPLTGDKPLIVYAGHNMSEDYLHDLLAVLDKKDYSLAVISKSGTTTEPAIAFRILKQHIIHKYGEQEAASRIVAITDKARGALKQLANVKGYKTYIVPDDVGGRFSVLTPVGLLPIAVAGIDIRQLVGFAICSGASGTLCPRQDQRNHGELRAALGLLQRMVEAALWREPRQAAQGHLPRLGHLQHRPPLDGTIHPGRPAQPLRDGDFG